MITEWDKVTGGDFRDAFTASVVMPIISRPLWWRVGLEGGSGDCCGSSYTWHKLCALHERSVVIESSPLERRSNFDCSSESGSEFW
jgi:hypothetical protein